MKLLRTILAIAALLSLAACSSTDEHGVTIEKSYFGSADCAQNICNS